MDETGEAVVIHNGMPLNNQFPTKAFKPGYIVRDSHMLEIPQELPLNSYRLFAGMYLLETGQITEIPIRPEDLKTFSGAKMINAMMDLETASLIEMVNIT